MDTNQYYIENTALALTQIADHLSGRVQSSYVSHIRSAATLLKEYAIAKESYDEIMAHLKAMEEIKRRNI